MDDTNRHEWKRRRWLKALGTAGIASSAGCIGGSGGNQSSSGGNVSTGSSGKWPDFNGEELHLITDESSQESKDFWNRIGKDFTRATGANIRTEFVGLGTSSTERLAQLLQAGDPPEIFTMNTANATSFRSQNILEPVGGALKKIANRIGEPEKQATLKIDGKQWFVPLWYNPITYFYRNDISDVVPETWQKAQEYAKEVDEASNNLRGTYVPAGSGAQNSFRLVSWMYSSGGSICTWDNDKIKVNYDSGKGREKMVQVLEYIKNRQQYSPMAADSTYTTWSNAIPNRVAGSTEYVGFRPVVQSVEQNRPFSNSLACLPGMPKAPGSDGTHQTTVSLEGLGTFKRANTAMAKSFMKFTMREKYLTQIYMNLTPVHNIPAYPEYRQSNAYQEALKGLSGAWPRETINTYQEKTNFKTRAADTQPPNPYANASYNSPPLWNMQVELLVQDKSPETVIDKYAPKHQDVIDGVQN